MKISAEWIFRAGILSSSIAESSPLTLVTQSQASVILAVAIAYKKNGA